MEVAHGSRRPFLIKDEHDNEMVFSAETQSDRVNWLRHLNRDPSLMPPEPVNIRKTVSTVKSILSRADFFSSEVQAPVTVSDEDFQKFYSDCLNTDITDTNNLHHISVIVNWLSGFHLMAQAVACALVRQHATGQYEGLLRLDEVIGNKKLRLSHGTPTEDLEDFPKKQFAVLDNEFEYFYHPTGLILCFCQDSRYFVRICDYTLYEIVIH